MNKNVMELMKEKFPTFSKSQKKISHYIIENIETAAFMTAARIGKATGVSESTVVRFASELGYDGYTGMQRALQEMIRSCLTSTQRIQVAGDRLSGQDILGTVLQSDIENLREMTAHADREAFHNVVNQILQAKHIYIVGVRSSSFVAGYLNFYMHLLFENVTLVQSNAAGDG